jgi:serine protease Do
VRQAAAPTAGLPSFADLVEQVSAAVVSIDATTFESAEERRRSQPFEFFMGPRDRGPDDQEFRRDSGGSGFVVSADGFVVTNNHVIRGAEQLKVRIADREYTAEVRGSDPATDLALLKVEGNGAFPFLALGDSETLRPGDWVMAIGSPAGLDNTVTVGVVSAKQRRIGISSETSSFENFIQTDAAINFGNSGGCAQIASRASQGTATQGAVNMNAAIGHHFGAGAYGSGHNEIPMPCVDALTRAHELMVQQRRRPALQRFGYRR